MTDEPTEPEKLRLGGMALRNGLLVHGPTHWAAAVATRARARSRSPPGASRGCTASTASRACAASCGWARRWR